jgi:succinate dehydrogenase/fumarate reductase flavoprotein subunit
VKELKRETLFINNNEFLFYRCHTLLVGSGAAALNCACHLEDFGIHDLVIATEHLGGGTSNNSGSDKQTYYKLSLFGEECDSVYEMARTLFSGGAMHGDIALIEATMSTPEFFHLVQGGVPFPHNCFGGYVGYKTDHDPKQRATSAGPWTSSQMFKALLAQVREKGIPILDRHEVIALLTTGQGEEKRTIGALAIDKTKVHLGLPSIVIFQAENIVFGTGGPGGLYKNSVYPNGHLGSTGVALEAGAKGVNLTEWQYGLASIQFRWNVSGTFQQVIPRYFSTEPDGSDEREFLKRHFPSMRQLATAIFLKGYQWPFDPRKIKDHGSSLIDILVHEETVGKGRRVFMDYRRNLSPEPGFGVFSLDDLETEAYTYLKKSHALLPTPIARLEQMNPMAIQLFKDNGIDLTCEPLEVAVCSQHHNGGLRGNIWWESNLRHFFPVGEVNGTHGIYRPGGSALNSGQVGGYRAADFIAHRYQSISFCKEEFLDLAKAQIEGTLELAKRALNCVGRKGQTISAFRQEFQERLSRAAAHIRALGPIRNAIQEAESQFARIESGNISLESNKGLVDFFQNRQLCLTQLAVLVSILSYLERGGGSRGSYLVLDEDGEPILEKLGFEWKFKPELKELRDYVQVYRYEKGEHLIEWETVRPIPEDNYWFENVWQSHLEKDIYQDEKGE